MAMLAGSAIKRVVAVTFLAAAAALLLAPTIHAAAAGLAFINTTTPTLHRGDGTSSATVTITGLTDSQLYLDASLAEWTKPCDADKLQTVPTELPSGVSTDVTFTVPNSCVEDDAVSLLLSASVHRSGLPDNKQEFAITAKSSSPIVPWIWLTAFPICFISILIAYFIVYYCWLKRSALKSVPSWKVLADSLYNGRTVLDATKDCVEALQKQVKSTQPIESVDLVRHMRPLLEKSYQARSIFQAVGSDVLNVRGQSIETEVRDLKTKSDAFYATVCAFVATILRFGGNDTQPNSGHELLLKSLAVFEVARKKVDQLSSFSNQMDDVHQSLDEAKTAADNVANAMQEVTTSGTVRSGRLKIFSVMELRHLGGTFSFKESVVANVTVVAGILTTVVGGTGFLTAVSDSADAAVALATVGGLISLALAGVAPIVVQVLQTRTTIITDIGVELGTVLTITAATGQLVVLLEGALLLDIGVSVLWIAAFISAIIVVLSYGLFNIWRTVIAGLTPSASTMDKLKDALRNTLAQEGSGPNGVQSVLAQFGLDSATVTTAEHGASIESIFDGAQATSALARPEVVTGPIGAAIP